MWTHIFIFGPKLLELILPKVKLCQVVILEYFTYHFYIHENSDKQSFKLVT